MDVPVLVVTGPVGVGKTTIALEAASLLEAAGIAHAVVDLDALTWSYPRPPDDGYNDRLAYRNLAAVWANFAAAGAERLILARVIEVREELEWVRDAIPGAAITVVRLRASGATLAARVAARELGAGREWHLRRAVELAGLMEQRAVEDHLVETDERAVVDIAADVLQRSGWLSLPVRRVSSAVAT
jgi:hypothetical protein